MKVKMIKDLNVGHTWIQKGEVLKVRVLPYAPFELSPFVVKPFQVIEGEYSGEEIPVTHCIVLEEEEKTYSEAEYNELKRKLEQANREKELLKEEINELIQERKTLLEQIERTVDERKVQLPRKVAEALDWHKKKGWVYWEYQVISRLFNENITDQAVLDLRNYIQDSWNDRFIKLLDALVNGYTVEEEQEFITNRKLDASEIREIRKWYKGALLRMEDGTDPDGFAKEAIEEVALYLGGAELLADISPFCKQQIEKEMAKSR